MKQVSSENIINSVELINSLELNDRVVPGEKIHKRQPHAFLTIPALSQDGVPMDVVEHKYLFAVIC